MADFTKKFGNIVNLFQSSKNSLNKCMDICSKELEELFDNYENLISIQETNRVLKEELIQKDTIINNLLAKDYCFLLLLRAIPCLLVLYLRQIFLMALQFY